MFDEGYRIDEGNVRAADALRFACDFKTPFLDDDTVRRMMKLYPCIASVMRLQTAVSTDGKVEYCEFVVTAETAEELMLRKVIEEIYGTEAMRFCRRRKLQMPGGHPEKKSKR